MDINIEIRSLNTSYEVIDGSALLALTLDDLRSVGIRLGIAKRIIAMIEDISANINQDQALNQSNDNAEASNESDKECASEKVNFLLIISENDIIF